MNSLNFLQKKNRFYQQQQQILSENFQLEKMAYFNLKCCSPSVSKIIVLVLNILVILIGGAHIGFAAQYIIGESALVLAFANQTATLKTYSMLIGPPKIFYLVGASIQILVSILAILLLFEILGKESKFFWFKIITALVVLELSCNFAMAVYSSLSAPYYKQLFEPFLAIDSSLIPFLPPAMQSLVNSVKNLNIYIIAEAIYTWVLAVPCISVILASIFGEFVDQNNDSSKVGPGARLNTQETTQVESFGGNNTLNTINAKK